MASLGRAKRSHTITQPGTCKKDPMHARNQFPPHDIRGDGPQGRTCAQVSRTPGRQAGSLPTSGRRDAQVLDLPPVAVNAYMLFLVVPAALAATKPPVVQ